MPRSKSYSDDLVLEKAMNVFWNNGYEGTSVRLLEKEMGINQFSIYSSFKNKKSLFISSIHKYREYVVKYRFYPLLQENAGLKELREFLISSAASKKADTVSRGCLIVNTAAEVGEKDEDIAREINLYYDFIRDMLKRVLQNAIVKKEIPESINVEKQANFFLGVMQGISIASKTMHKRQLTDFIKVALEQLE